MKSVDRTHELSSIGCQNVGWSKVRNFERKIPISENCVDLVAASDSKGVESGVAWEWYCLRDGGCGAWGVGD
jgi:hypothetical protein